MLLNCGVGEGSWVPGLQEIQTVHPKGNQSWMFIGRTDAKAETLILWPLDAMNWLIGKDPAAGTGLEAGREGDDRGWDSWMASLTWWTWIWVNSGSWWWTGRPVHHGVAKSQTRLSDWTELNWEPVESIKICYCYVRWKSSILKENKTSKLNFNASKKITLNHHCRLSHLLHCINNKKRYSIDIGWLSKNNKTKATFQKISLLVK